MRLTAAGPACGSTRSRPMPPLSAKSWRRWAQRPSRALCRAVCWPHLREALPRTCGSGRDTTTSKGRPASWRRSAWRQSPAKRCWTSARPPAARRSCWLRKCRGPAVSSAAMQPRTASASSVRQWSGWALPMSKPSATMPPGRTPACLRPTASWWTPPAAAWASWPKSRISATKRWTRPATMNYWPPSRPFWTQRPLCSRRAGGWSTPPAPSTRPKTKSRWRHSLPATRNFPS